MKLTLSIPFHSRPVLLAKTLASVLAQSDPNWDCLICDDSGTGEAESLVRDLADSRFSYVRNPNPQGMAANWNFCLDRSRGDWVALLHADDELMPGYVSLIRKMGEQNPQATAFYCQAEVIDEASRSVFSFPDYIKGWIDPSRGKDLCLVGEAGAAALLRGNFIMCPTLCYRREVAAREGFSDRFRMVQDFDFTLRLLEGGGEIRGSGQTAYRYRRHAENATALMTSNLHRFHEEQVLYDEFASRARIRGWKTAAKVAAGKRIIKLHLGFRIFEDLLRLRLGAAVRKTWFLLGLRGRSPKQSR